jgi:hypothetical protein
MRKWESPDSLTPHKHPKFIIISPYILFLLLLFSSQDTSWLIVKEIFTSLEVKILVGISSWDTRHWGSLAGSNIFLCWHRLSGLESTGWALRTKGSHLIYFARRLQKQKAKLNPYMFACNFIGYFIVTWPFLCFNSLSFISLLWHHFPLLHYQNTNLSVSSLVLLLATLFPLWCLDPPGVKEHHLDLGVR